MLGKGLRGHAKTKELYESREKKIFELESKLKEYKAIDLIYRDHEEEFAAEMRKFVTSTSNVSHLQTIIRQLVSSNVLLKEHLSKNNEEKKLMRKKLAQMERMQSEKDKFLALKESQMSEMGKKIAMLENLKSGEPEEDVISSSQPVKASSTPILPRSLCTDDSDIQYLDDIGRFENSYLRKKDLNSPVTPMLAQKRKNPFLKMSDDESDEVTEIPAYQPDTKKLSLSQVLGHEDDCSEDIVLVKPVEKVTKPNRLFKTASFHSGLKSSKNSNDSIEIKPLTKNTSSYVCDGLGGRQKVFKSDNLKSYFVTSNSKGQKLSKLSCLQIKAVYSLYGKFRLCQPDINNIFVVVGLVENVNNCSQKNVSMKTLNVVKTALSKHENPVPCDLCGELMKNIKGLSILVTKYVTRDYVNKMFTFFCEQLFTFSTRPRFKSLQRIFVFVLYSKIHNASFGRRNNYLERQKDYLAATITT
ncbi:hypothetical protein BpHYR1_004054 [Brachionus plicatilis]|uniref:Uncharacterized protein n=1 Tax=Brachionus plicatilis TaxID=10195 RepID=A0A3M7QZ19_BRAPC|nr:hypothetical protein BpHYR1_004054 [Brachionus plicatilis]